MSQADPGYRTQDDSVIIPARAYREPLMCQRLTTTATIVKQQQKQQQQQRRAHCALGRVTYSSAYLRGGEYDASPDLPVEEIRTQFLRVETSTPKSNHQDCHVSASRWRSSG